MKAKPEFPFPTFPELRDMPPRHPQDRKDWEEAKAEAAKYGPGLVAGEEVAEYLRQLVLTYADADAEAGLERVREWFWGGALSARAKEMP